MKRNLLTRIVSCALVGVIAVSSAALLTACNGRGGDASSMTQSEKDRQALRETITNAVKRLSDRQDELSIATVSLDDEQLKLVVVAKEISDELKDAVGEYISTDFVIFKTLEENKPSAE